MRFLVVALVAAVVLTGCTGTPLGGNQTTNTTTSDAGTTTAMSGTTSSSSTTTTPPAPDCSFWISEIVGLTTGQGNNKFVRFNLELDTDGDVTIAGIEVTGKIGLADGEGGFRGTPFTRSNDFDSGGSSFLARPVDFSGRYRLEVTELDPVDNCVLDEELSLMEKEHNVVI